MKKDQVMMMFQQNPNDNVFDFEGKCCDCQKEITVTIQRVEDFVSCETIFDVFGGAIHQKADKFKLKCSECYQFDPYFEGKTEVYSRVIGYYRPIQQYNKGIKASFENRKMFDVYPVVEMPLNIEETA